MDASATGDFLRWFQELQDPRRSNRRFLLSDILLLAVSAVMCGCEGWQDIADWTEDAFEFLAPLMLKPEHGTPSADTFRRVFSVLSPEQFERSFAAWSGSLEQSSEGRLIAIDGKSLRRSFAHSWSSSRECGMISLNRSKGALAGSRRGGCGSVTKRTG